MATHAAGLSGAGSSLSDRVAAVLGAKVAALLQPLEVEVPAQGVRITGWVHTGGGSHRGLRRVRTQRHCV